MKRTAVITTSEGGRQEIDYSAMSDAEIARQIASYEKKYGAALPTYLKTFSDDAADPFERFDIMDWETLVEERDERAAARPQTIA